MACLTIPDNGSLVRIFHAVPNAPSVDVYVNNTLIFQNLSFMEFTNYVPLNAGQYNIIVFATNDTTQPLISVSLDVPDQAILTVAATGTLDDLQLLPLNDTYAEGPSPDYSVLRFVHLSPNAPAVDISLDQIPFIQNLGFRQMSPFVQEYPALYRVTVVTADTKTPVFTSQLQLNPDLISSIYIIGEAPDLRIIQSIDGSSNLCE